jgi:hypothetical protein
VEIIPVALLTIKSKVTTLLTVTTSTLLGDKENETIVGGKDESARAIWKGNSKIKTRPEIISPTTECRTFMFTVVLQLRLYDQNLALESGCWHHKWGNEYSKLLELGGNLLP